MFSIYSYRKLNQMHIFIYSKFYFWKYDTTLLSQQMSTVFEVDSKLAHSRLWIVQGLYEEDLFLFKRRLRFNSQTQ